MGFVSLNLSENHNIITKQRPNGSVYGDNSEQSSPTGTGLLPLSLDLPNGLCTKSLCLTRALESTLTGLMSNKNLKKSLRFYRSATWTSTDGVRHPLCSTRISNQDGKEVKKYDISVRDFWNPWRSLVPFSIRNADTYARMRPLTCEGITLWLISKTSIEGRSLNLRMYWELKRLM